MSSKKELYMVMADVEVDYGKDIFIVGCFTNYEAAEECIEANKKNVSKYVLHNTIYDLDAADRNHYYSDDPYVMQLTANEIDRYSAPHVNFYIHNVTLNTSCDLEVSTNFRNEPEVTGGWYEFRYLE